MPFPDPPLSDEVRQKLRDCLAAGGGEFSAPRTQLLPIFCCTMPAPFGHSMTGRDQPEGTILVTVYNTEAKP